MTGITRTKTQKPRQIRRLMADPRARQLVGAAGLVALMTIAAPAFAQTSIETGLSTIKTWMTTVASVVGIIAIMAVGYAKLTGRMDWGRAVAVLIGIGIIFSAATIVGWMGGSTS
jgi:type IV secretion system protein VirB2